jgi:hypothetical protein
MLGVEKTVKIFKATEDVESMGGLMIQVIMLKMTQKNEMFKLYYIILFYMTNNSIML